MNNLEFWHLLFVFEVTRRPLGDSSGYISSVSPPTLSLRVSSCLQRSQPAGIWLKSSNA